MIFFDRYGKEHTPPESAVLKSREGAFNLIVNKGHVLFLWEDYAPNVADLPGGGIDEGENAFQASVREFHEETGMVYPFTESDSINSHHQIVQYYADVDDEYWTYTQTYFLIKKDCSSIFFEGDRKTPENGLMRWIPFSLVKKQPIHFMHNKAFQAFNAHIHL
jgi:8-oxo-dGTP pyrophosphatase MutT (NUDIX family)